MSDELKLCPFCKSKPKRIKVKLTWNGKIPPDIHHPKHKRCYLANENFYEDEWQIRPIEDALLKRAKRTEKALKNLVDACHAADVDGDLSDRISGELMIAAWNIVYPKKEAR